MSSDLATGITDIGGAISDLFGSQGSAAAATSYTEAASVAAQNEQITAEATSIKEAQQSRQIYQTIGTQKAQVGGAGFAESGTALDLLASSASQGALTKALTAEQGAITENSFSEQAGLYNGMASAATSTSNAQSVGGVLQAAGGVISLASAAPWSSIGDAIGDVAIGILGTVICTELHRQGRLSHRLYLLGAIHARRYDEIIMRGYYYWAVPAVRHLRKSPDSLLSRSLEWVFNKRAEYIAAKAGDRSARVTIAGLATYVAMHAVCWILSRTVARTTKDWKGLYAT